MKKENLINSNLKKGQKYSHSKLGIVTLCDMENLCFSDCWNTFHLINLKDLTPLKK
jgi:hypothetical protein